MRPDLEGDEYLMARRDVLFRLAERYRAGTHSPSDALPACGTPEGRTGDETRSEGNPVAASGYSVGEHSNTLESEPRQRVGVRADALEAGAYLLPYSRGHKKAYGSRETISRRIVAEKNATATTEAAHG